MDKILFKGCAAALITPFCENGIDYDAFERIVEFQIDNGTDALVFCGTTGEAPTLKKREWEEIIKFARSTCAGRVPVIIGCGSNNTEEAKRKVRRAEKLGADGALVVTPYYNKATPEGLFRHFSETASSTSLPIILYNVPSRTGVDIPIEVYIKLAEIHNICGIKEASGSVGKAALVMSELRGAIPLYSGSDEVNLPILSIGGTGMISVLSNVFPKECALLYNLVRSGELEKASGLANLLYPFTSSLFCEVNPIPVKTVMAEMGLCLEKFRLPMCGISEANRRRVLEEYHKAENALSEDDNKREQA